MKWDRDFARLFGMSELSMATFLPLKLPPVTTQSAFYLSCRHLRKSLAHQAMLPIRR